MSKLYELVEEILQFSYALGFFSELIISIVIVYVLYAQIFNLSVYLVGFVVSVYLNRWLKACIQDKRPTHPIPFLASERFSTSKQQNYYGMPSGHSQQVAYSIVYLYGTIHQWVPWTTLCAVIGVLMVFERWWFRNHTMLQLLVGILVGVAFAHIVMLMRDIYLCSP